MYLIFKQKSCVENKNVKKKKNIRFLFFSTPNPQCVTIILLIINIMIIIDFVNL